MKPTILVARAGALFVLLLSAARLSAADGVTRWERTFRSPQAGVGSQGPLAARELADGTTLTVVRDNAGLTTLHYDHAGTLLSSSTFYPTYFPAFPAKISIDAFGGLVVASNTTEGSDFRNDLWLRKFDGLTGDALWPAGVTYGATNHGNDEVVAVFVDPAGDVVLEAAGQFVDSHAFSKYRGTDGALLWGPVVTVADQAPWVAALDAAGNVVLAQRTGSFPNAALRLTQYAGATGAILWQTVEVGHDLMPVTLGFDGSGDFVVTGRASGNTGSVEAARYAGQTGQRIWGPAVWTPPAGNYGTAPVVAAVGADGSVVIFATTTDNNQATEVLLKFRGADGGLLWGPILSTDPAEGSYGATLSLAGNGDPILSAQFQTDPSSVDSRMWRYDGSTGAPLWGPQIFSSAAIGATFVGSNGGVFVATMYVNATDADAQILECDGSTGVPSWGPKTFLGAADGYAHFWDLTASPDGNVVVTGASQDADGAGAWATLKYDRTTGSVLWGPVFFTTGLYPFVYSPWQVLTDASGDVFVAGQSTGGMTVVKYAGATGAQLWSAASSPSVSLSAFALDPNGNPIVAGYDVNELSQYDAVTVKLSGSTGAPLWGPIVYDSGSDDFPDRVAADPAGNVILLGHSSFDPPGFLVKYASADGSLLWGPSSPLGYPSGLAVDSQGDAFVETYSAGITTTKFSGATGATLWGPLTVGDPGSGYGAALVLNAAGDVFVTGSLYSGTTFDYAVIKYHGSDGAVLWGPMTYDSGGKDYPYSVVLDGSGNAVVTGASSDSSNEWTTATLSYDGATGALRWGAVGQNIARETVNGLASAGSSVYVGATRSGVGFLVTAIDEALGIVRVPAELPAASCGHAIDDAIGSLNGTPSYTWSVTSGALPPGVLLGPNGHVAGTPTQEGSYAFRVRVQDSTMASASRDFTLVVGPGSDLVPIALAVSEVTCQITLSVPGSFASYAWLPGGETTPTITVNPDEATTYGVVLDDGTTCRVRGAVTITPFDPDCVAPLVYGISPTFGPAGRSFLVSGNRFQDGAAISIGGVLVTDVVFESAMGLEGHVPVLSPGSVNDVTVVNPDGRYGMVLRRFAADFLDVAQGNPFYSDIMKVDLAGITAGCGGGNYCPNGSVSRAQMAVFLLKAEHGFSYVPPVCTGVFSDVACPGGFAVDWIERLAAEGITGGCGGGNYCPDAVVTRAQMSAFLLKAEHGSSYVPPACTGVFDDVPCGSPFADWIEQLAAEQITSGCGGNDYCPASPNSRAQMAVFLRKTFGLQ